MKQEPNKNPRGIEDESKFEASLTISHDADLLSAEARAVKHNHKQPAWIGKKMGHYKLLRLIGQGNMGMVIQALDVNLERIVALKVLRKKIAGVEGEKQVQQFLREARAAAKIEHPNVVRIYEINQHEGWWYIAMEMLEGESLRRVIQAAGPLPPGRACPLIADAATALDVAHREGIIHRDIKPANLMITRSGHCKLADFGLVRMDDPNDPFEFASKTVGTPFFMAPEIIQRQNQTVAVDVYSLGCTLYYALTGKPPFEGDDMTDLLRKHLKAPIPDVQKEVPNCSPALSDLVSRMMAKNPSERPTAADVAAALRAESIGFFPAESGGLTAASSTALTQALEKALDSLSDTSGSKVFGKTLAVEESGRINKKKQLIWAAAGLGGILVATALFFAASALLTDSDSSSAVRPVQTLQERFPDAPQTYGLLGPGASPEIQNDVSQPPAFSWIGKKDATGFKYVASRNGRYFYSKGDPAAALITSENFVGYKTAEAARADGKIPAP